MTTTKMTTTTKIIIGIVVASAVIGGAYYFYKKRKANTDGGNVLRDDKALPIDDNTLPKKKPTTKELMDYAKIPNFANPFGDKYKN